MKNSFNTNFTNLLDEAEILAFKALDAGNANERQQKIALNALIKKICRIGKISYCPESSRNSDFNEGVRYVGIQISSAILCDLEAIKKNQQQTQK